MTPVPIEPPQIWTNCGSGVCNSSLSAAVFGTIQDFISMRGVKRFQRIGR
jgi:hypothetical protein